MVCAPKLNCLAAGKILEEKSPGYTLEDVAVGCVPLGAAAHLE